jgi:hypothetical protein
MNINFFIFLIFSLLISWFPLDAKLLMLAYDMGETKVFEQLSLELEKQQEDYCLITMATADVNASTLSIPKDKIFSLPKNCKNFSIDAQNWKREDSLSQTEINTILESIESLHPTAILTGTSSKAQWQILTQYQDIPKFAYYDNVNMLVSDNPNKATIARFTQKDITLMVPSTPIAKDLNQSPCIITVVGHPQLENIVNKLKNRDQDQLKTKYGFSKSDQIITYIGGYDHGYEEAFELFSSNVEALQQKYPVKVIVQTHPKCKNLAKTNLVEYKILQNYNVQNVTYSQGEISTDDAIGMATLVTSQASTVIPQALFANIPAVFMNPMEVKNTLIEAGLATNIQSSDEFIETMEHLEQFESNVYEQAQIPSNSVSLMLKTIGK